MCSVPFSPCLSIGPALCLPRLSILSVENNSPLTLRIAGNLLIHFAATLRLASLRSRVYLEIKRSVLGQEAQD